MAENSSVEYTEERLRISPRSFARLAQFVTAKLGIKMPDSKVPMIQSRLIRRLRELGIASIEEYCEHLFSAEGAEAERVHFIDAVTTNKTDFFREPQHFRYLTGVVLPKLTAAGGIEGNRLAVWSAACSSGQEPYTLAIVLSEYAASRPPFDFHILATDVSTKVLHLAKDGIYGRQAIEPVPPELRRRYFLQGKNALQSVRVKPALRRRVSFHHLNFMDSDYGVREIFDVIFCRNVLIYFDRPTQEAVITKLCRNLKPAGYLFVSHSESLSGLELPLVPLGSSCFRKSGE